MLASKGLGETGIFFAQIRNQFSTGVDATAAAAAAAAVGAPEPGPWGRGRGGRTPREGGTGAAIEAMSSPRAAVQRLVSKLLGLPAMGHRRFWAQVVGLDQRSGTDPAVKGSRPRHLADVVLR